MKVNLTKVYEKYKGIWVAMDSNLKTVVAADKDASRAYNKAIKKGHKPTMLKAPLKSLPYFGFSNN